MRAGKIFVGLVLATGLAAVFLTSCGSDSDNDSERTIRIGTLLPLTGSLSDIGPPTEAAAQLAEAEVNAAPTAIKVELIERDSGTNGEVAGRAAGELIAQNVDAIVGAVASGVSLATIDQIIGSGTLMMSPASSSSIFSTYDDNGLFFRTAASLTTWAEAAANRVRNLLADEADEDKTALVINRDDEFGVKFTETVVEDMRSFGVNVLPGSEYPSDDTSDFANIAARTATADDGAPPSAIVVVAFQEAGELLRELLAAGINPQNTHFVMSGTGGFDLGSRVNPDNPGIIEGIEELEVSQLSDAEPTFLSRLQNYAPGVSESPYAYTTYDAVIILALAALEADSTDPQDVAAEINGITRGGRECRLFAECAAMIADGQNILYNGATGAFNFREVGEPTSAAYDLYTYTAEGIRQRLSGEKIQIVDAE